VEEGDYGFAVDDADQVKLLGVGRTDGNDEASGFAELGEQGGRDVERCGGDEDGVERSIVGKAKCAVAGEHADAGVAERGENGAGVFGEAGMTFDREDIRGQFGEKRGGVSGAGTDFEDGVGCGELEGFQHQGYDVGLGDGLAVTDGEWVIFVGFGAIGPGYEFVTGDAEHGVEDAGIGDAAGAELGVDHVAAGFGLLVAGFGHSCFFAFACLRKSGDGAVWLTLYTG
jgi:hypothetical protein